jgi:dTDP-4-amino-4,6-dideoxygalactose transaminase
LNAFQVVKDFEKAICEYTGAPYCVTTNSCTAALLLACKYLNVSEVSIPKFTYVGVPMSIVHAGGTVKFRDENWSGTYQLKPYPIWDSARRFTSNMYKGGYECVSFHWSKILGIQQGGAILHDDKDADQWFRRARFDGRTEGVAPKDDTFDVLGHHCYLSPEIAAEGLVRLSFLPRHNADLANSDYPDLSKAPVFK